MGTVSHTLMTLDACRRYDITVAGLVINCLEHDGYSPQALEDDLNLLTDVPILATIPRISSIDDAASALVPHI